MKLSLPEPLKSLLGEIEAKAVTNIYGEPGAGKTNICLLALVECIRKGGKAVFIDTEGGFSTERLKQLTQDYDSILERTEFIEPKTFEEQGNAVRALKDKKPDLVILDSAVALYRLEYADGKRSIDVNRELSKQLSVLSNLARERGIPVLITAHMFRNWDTKRNEIIGGEIIKYWSKAILYLERTGKTSERQAFLIKHRSLPEGKNVKFMLVQEGIKPSGFRIF